MSKRIFNLTGGAICVVAATLIGSVCCADAIYKSTDAQGNVTYSSKPPGPDAKPAELPKIQREKSKHTAPQQKTCKGHGDVNCEAGADSDGSVICSDGFRDASARFNFTCKASKLEITDISEIDKDGGMKVFVRNLKGVEATGAHLRMLSDGGDEIQLKGPEVIEAFGVAEYVYEVPANPALKHKPAKAQLTLECQNCP